ncbi:MAG: hypothetical protein JNL57_09225 [Bacteroidetes bacterium]|nr:hypothetical protein [Bacteroidota bacterium]
MPRIYSVFPRGLIYLSFISAFSAHAWTNTGRDTALKLKYGFLHTRKVWYYSGETAILQSISGTEYKGILRFRDGAVCADSQCISLAQLKAVTVLSKNRKRVAVSRRMNQTATTWFAGLFGGELAYLLGRQHSQQTGIILAAGTSAIAIAGLIAVSTNKTWMPGKTNYRGKHGKYIFKTRKLPIEYRYLKP